MNLLFTGASSFTGMWFVKELAESGFNVTATFTRSKDDYQGLRKERVEIALKYCKPLFNCPFGSDSFIKNIDNFDIFCHHAADVTDYKSLDFDFTKALSNNCKNVDRVLKTLQDKGLKKVILTGSVFEQNEGEGTSPLIAFSPYGLSKGLTADVFKYFTALYKIKLGKFVIPNPFGPYEEARFTSYLVKSWFKESRPKVSSPLYIRDNIHVTLLAKSYMDFVKNLNENPGFEKFNPSGLRASQGEFTKYFADNLQKRLNVACDYELCEQTDFLEPLERFNLNQLDHDRLGWNEEKSWDELAEYYQTIRN